jgi:hypothetical protein
LAPRPTRARTAEVRIRKENQVISAEEKRGLLQLQAEEKVKREAAIISSFKESASARSPLALLVQGLISRS